MSVHVRVTVGGESYALPVAGVREVADLEEVAPVPGSPREILGLSNVHGQVVPIVDLGEVLGTSPRDTPARILIAEDRGRTAGLAVDAVIGVEVIAAAEASVDSPHVSGAALIDGALVGVIDIREVFDSIGGGPHT
jgi:purine-binding chemotaxis protein CheW